MASISNIYTSIFGKRFGISHKVGANAALTLDGFNVAAIPTGGPTVTSTSDGITALAGGAYGASTPVMNANINRLATVATTSDSITLPQAFVGAEMVVINEGAATAAVFPALGTTDIINALTTGVSLPLGSSRIATFFCTAAGKWRSQTAATS